MCRERHLQQGFPSCILIGHGIFVGIANVKNISSTAHILVAALSLAIQQRRARLGLSQDEVAKRSGLHRTYISELERQSRNFSVRSLLLLCDALQVRPSELFRQAESIADGASSGDRGCDEVSS